MQNISEVREIIDELETRIETYGDKAVWQKSSQTDWYTFIVEKGPKLIQSWRELAALVGLTPGDQLIELQAKLESIQQMVSNQEVMQLALKLNKKSALLKGE
jgi:hypothetical protein